MYANLHKAQRPPVIFADKLVDCLKHRLFSSFVLLPDFKADANSPSRYALLLDQTDIGYI